MNHIHANVSDKRVRKGRIEKYLIKAFYAKHFISAICWFKMETNGNKEKQIETTLYDRILV